MDQNSLKNLLKILKKAGVSRFKDQTLDISFFCADGKPTELIADPDETTLPVDLRAENINDPERVLHWSDNSVNDETPLAGDEPL